MGYFDCPYKVICNDRNYCLPLFLKKNHIFLLITHAAPCQQSYDELKTPDRHLIILQIFSRHLVDSTQTSCRHLIDISYR